MESTAMSGCHRYTGRSNLPPLLLLLHLLLLLLPPPATPLEPFSAGIAVGVGALASALWSSKDTLTCPFRECCREPWIRKNVTLLDELMTANVFGQHVAHSVVTKSLRAHLRNKNPSKALVLSFHGWTGSGKNFVSQFIAQSLYKEGMSSQFVHLFVAPLHFPFQGEADIYKLQVQDWIRGNVSECHTSLFIFDEIDKMPPGVIDGIKPFIDHHEKVLNVDFRRSIFIFLSNSGGNAINEKIVEHFESGRVREELDYHDLEQFISLDAYNEDGGLMHSSVIETSLVDMFVPFFPLERKHVKLCIRREALVRNRTVTSEEEDMIANSMVYWPEYSQIFSTTGCKRVANKMDLLLDDPE